MTQISTLTAAIDSAKDTLDIAVHGPDTPRTPAPRAGWRQIASQFKRTGVNRVGIEATGGYERGVVQHLRQAGFMVLVLPPMQAKAFARLTLRRA